MLRTCMHGDTKIRHLSYFSTHKYTLHNKVLARVIDYEARTETSSRKIGCGTLERYDVVIQINVINV